MTTTSRRSPPLSEAMILAWADACHDRWGKWPKNKKDQGRIAGTLGEKWVNVDMALRKGLRDLAGGSSLARLLAERRGVRNHMALLPLSSKKILAWADVHYRQTGGWPHRDSGSIEGAPGEAWLAVNLALVQGHRGLPGGSSLAQLLAEERNVRTRADVPSLSAMQILVWADAHYHRAGKWPRRTSGPLLDAHGETWLAIHAALQKGQRGLPGGSSLARLLASRRGVRNHKAVPSLTVSQIVAWVKAYRRRTGKWPSRYSGPIVGSGGESWSAIDTALCKGQRGLPGGSSLPRVLAQHYIFDG